jgi:hypothetical protein
MTPYETRSMRALAALRMVWASAAWMAVEMLATCVSTHACGIILNRAVQHDEYSASAVLDIGICVCFYQGFFADGGSV